jgi:hypothetical protein
VTEVGPVIGVGANVVVIGIDGSDHVDCGPCAVGDAGVTSAVRVA